MSPLALAAVGGAAAGAGVWLLLLVRFARSDLAQRLADPAPPPRPAAGPAPKPGWSARLGAHAAPLLAAFGLPGPRARAHLAICERDPADYLAEKAATLMLAGLAAPAVVGALAAAGGAHPPPLLGATLWGTFAVAAWYAPDLALRRHAEQRRTQMRHSAAALADLTVIALAGGAGVSGALADATSAGRTWAMRRIRTAVRSAAIRREPPWRALEDLGERYQVPAFTELAASLRLAGTDGARVRASLAAKAHTLRTQHLAHLEAQAQSATERMSLPVVLMFAAFLVLIGYPALSLVMTTL